MYRSVKITDVVPIPTASNRRVVQINLNGVNGNVVFHNGTILEFTEATTDLLRLCNSADVVEINSNGGSIGFSYNNKIWDKIFFDTQRAKFFGTWDPRLAKFFLLKLKHALCLSFTYWECYNISSVIDSIISPSITELSIHVTYDQVYGVINSFRRWGLNDGGKLKRLMIVTNCFFDFITLDELQRDVVHLVSCDAEVIFLFGSERRECAKTLSDRGFLYHRQIQMATNKLYEDNTVSKHYETYEVYRKIENGISWFIGSRVGVFNLPFSHPFFPFEVQNVEKSEVVEFPNADEYLSWFADYHGFMSYSELCARNQMTSYPETEFVKPETYCCDPVVQIVQYNHLCEFKLPGWTTITIDKVIYNNKCTEFLTSNGFYIILDDMNIEREFFKKLRGSTRLVFVSTNSDRRYIVNENLTDFLQNVTHVEFLGQWFVKPIQNIVAMFSSTIKHLTMVQLELHTTIPLRFIFNVIPPNIRRDLRSFHFDARATADQSVASIVNALRNSGIYDAQGKLTNELISLKLDDLLIISNNWTEKKYNKFRLWKHFKDIQNFLNYGGSGTTIVMEDWSKTEYQKAGVIEEDIDILVPVAYPNRGGHHDVRLMRCYRDSTKDYYIFMVVPEF